MTISDNQRKEINRLTDVLNDMGFISSKTNSPIVLDDVFLSRLTGGLGGSGSQMIQYLKKTIEDFKPNAKITKKQCVTIANWYTCMEVPFEDYGITRKVYLGFYVKPNKEAWRFKTVLEFATDVKNTFTYLEADELIKKYTKIVKMHNATRITNFQRTQILSLLNQIHDLTRTRRVEYPAELDGSQADVPLTPPISREYHLDVHYEKPEYIEFYTQEQAEQLIKQLSEEAIYFQNYTEKNQDEVMQQENPLLAMRDFYYRIQAISGFPNETIEDYLSYNDATQDDYDMLLKKYRRHYVSYFKYCLKRELIDIDTLIQEASKYPHIMKMLLLV